jgi:hypothetical protein
MKPHLLSVALLFVLLFAACKKPDYQKIFNDPSLYSRTVHELNGVVMGNNFTPVVASRNYAYANIAAYEVVAAGDPAAYQSLVRQLNGLNKVAKPHDPAKIDFQFAAIMAFCRVGEAVTFPEGSMKLYVDSLLKLAADHGMPKEILDSSVNFAKAVSMSIMAWSKKDNYIKTRSASKFAINDSAGRWVPTPPAYTEAVEPHWAELRPMVIKNLNDFQVPPPPVFNVTDKNSKYYHEVIAIKNAIDSLTPEQAHIADFWDDNPGKLNVSGHIMFVTKKFSPPGHWMSIVGIGAEKAKADFNTTVCAYAKTSIALFDGFIQCWVAKYKYKTMRPETAINKFFNADWRPHLQTPPFPEYTCGHTTISAAAAEALTSVLGDHVAYTDTSELEFGIKSRSYPSFRAAAMENIWARFYGGVHFHNSCIVSNHYGTLVGDYIVDHVVMKKTK